MRLKYLKIRNFRCYRNETIVNLNNLTAFIGRNDSGKSSILEALEIFFNNSIVKIEREDLNVEALAAGENRIEITCVFNQLPDQLIIDAANPREQVFIVANHPTVENGNDLLMLKRQELRQRASDLNVPPANYNGNLNSSLRSAIWGHLGQLNLERVEIQVDKEDAKKAWDYISRWMPQFALFKSDRESSDGDKEVTDPMKIAINMALGDLQTELSAIQQRVMERAIEVADRTLEKLQEMNPALASQLTPNFKADPKWSGLFGLTLASDRNISINKRGSGVRRLIVLNFFRAEAERRRNDNNSQAIIYAFEEPESSQHPDHQIMLINAFKDLADAENTQVLLTTHNPALAGLIHDKDLRLVILDAALNSTVQENPANIMRRIADTLGMLPEPLKPRLLVCVEGPNDVIFFKNISATIHANREDLPDLSTDTRIAIFPLGGGTLKDWVTQDYLSGLGTPQYHIYDLDDPINPTYSGVRDTVRARGGNNWAELTRKREIENYLHPTAIQTIYGFQIVFGDLDDVPEIVARTQHTNSPGANPWAGLDEETKKKKVSHAKRRLNREVTQIMSYHQIQESDANGDIISFLSAIRDRIQ